MCARAEEGGPWSELWRLELAEATTRQRRAARDLDAVRTAAPVRAEAPARLVPVQPEPFPAPTTRRLHTRRRLRTWLMAAVAMVVLRTAAPASAGPCPPPVGEVRRAAARHAGLDRAPRWRARARLAGLLPVVTVRGDRATDWDDRLDGQPDGVGHRVRVEARLTWHLDRLLYDPAEPRLIAAEQVARRERVALDREVTRLYFVWRRARLDASEDGDPGRALDAAEAAAQLDALTGDWLSRRACPGPEIGATTVAAPGLDW